MTDKSIADRLSDLESKMDFLIHRESPRIELTQPDFMSFYNRIEKMLPDDCIIPYCLWIDEKYENCLKHKVLYPDDDSGFWYPIRKTTKDLPIAFKSLPYDFLIDCYLGGDFDGKRSTGGKYE